MRGLQDFDLLCFKNVNYLFIFLGIRTVNDENRLKKQNNLIKLNVNINNNNVNSLIHVCLFVMSPVTIYQTHEHV